MKDRDPHEVAAVVAAGMKRGLSASAAVAEHYRIAPNSACAAIRRARLLGADLPAPSRGPSAGFAKNDMADIAAVAIAASKAGKPVCLAVAERFGVTRRYASNLVAQARRSGHPIPYDYGVAGPPGSGMEPRTKPVEAAGLACDCGATFPLTVGALITHTLTEHGRPPYRSERIPKPAA